MCAQTFHPFCAKLSVGSTTNDEPSDKYWLKSCHLRLPPGLSLWPFPADLASWLVSVFFCSSHFFVFRHIWNLFQNRTSATALAQATNSWVGSSQESLMPLKVRIFGLDGLSSQAFSPFFSANIHWGVAAPPGAEPHPGVVWNQPVCPTPTIPPSVA